jgi:hypothetical protein
MKIFDTSIINYSKCFLIRSQQFIMLVSNNNYASWFALKVSKPKTPNHFDKYLARVQSIIDDRAMMIKIGTLEYSKDGTQCHVTLKNCGLNMTIALQYCNGQINIVFIDIHYVLKSVRTVNDVTPDVFVSTVAAIKVLSR